MHAPGVEPEFTGIYWDHFVDGTYRCIRCEASVFDASAKYDANTGWASFTNPVTPDAVTRRAAPDGQDPRTLVHCGSCGAHLGHVVPDGPAPSGYRYSLNSSSLDFTPRAHGPGA